MREFSDDHLTILLQCKQVDDQHTVLAVYLRKVQVNPIGNLKNAAKLLVRILAMA